MYQSYQPNLSGRLEQSVVEYDYYQLLKKRKIPLDYLPECYGWIDTNLGKGLAYEKIVGNSELLLIFTLRDALQKNIVTIGGMYKLLDELRLYLLSYGIAVSDLSMNNIMLKFGEGARLYLIDGVGGRNFDLKYKIRKRFSFYAKYKLKQQWPKLLSEIKKELSFLTSMSR